MALELRQQLKLSQQLVMTPQLQQAIKLLQLSRVELLETVQQELLENPFLEEAPANEPVAPQDQEESRHEKPQDEVYDEDLSRNADWEEYLGEFASTPRTSQGRELEIAEEISPLEARYSAKPTLEGHLLWQLHLSTLTDEQKEIGEIIIGNLGSSGYLRASVEEIAEMASTTPEAVQTVLERVQLFDPVGVAARDARECLLVQLKNLRYDRDPILLELVQSHLEDLEAHRYKPLLRKFKLDMEGLREYLDIIQSLEPLPGASFDGSEPTASSPKYTDTLKIDKPCTLKAVIVRPSGNSRIFTEEIGFNKASMKPITMLQPINKQYEYEGAITLVDGLKGNGNYKTGRWIAFWQNDMEAVIDLQQPTEISEAQIETCVAIGDWVFDARYFAVAVSDDGQTYKTVAEADYPVMKQGDRNGVYEHKLTFDPVQARYVKITVKPEHSMPAWHGGKGSPAFVFIDEISLN